MNPDTRLILEAIESQTDLLIFIAQSVCIDAPALAKATAALKAKTDALKAAVATAPSK